MCSLFSIWFRSSTYVPQETVTWEKMRTNIFSPCVYSIGDLWYCDPVTVILRYWFPFYQVTRSCSDPEDPDLAVMHWVPLLMEKCWGTAATPMTTCPTKKARRQNNIRAVRENNCQQGLLYLDNPFNFLRSVSTENLSRRDPCWKN